MGRHRRGLLTSAWPVLAGWWLIGGLLALGPLRPWVPPATLLDVTSGLYLTERAGLVRSTPLRPGDLVLRVNDQAVSSPAELSEAVQRVREPVVRLTVETAPRVRLGLVDAARWEQLREAVDDQMVVLWTGSEELQTRTRALDALFAEDPDRQVVLQWQEGRRQLTGPLNLERTKVSLGAFWLWLVTGVVLCVLFWRQLAALVPGERRSVGAAPEIVASGLALCVLLQGAEGGAHPSLLLALGVSLMAWGRIEALRRLQLGVAALLRGAGLARVLLAGLVAALVWAHIQPHRLPSVEGLRLLAWTLVVLYAAGAAIGALGFRQAQTRLRPLWPVAWLWTLPWTLLGAIVLLGVAPLDDALLWVAVAVSASASWAWGVVTSLSSDTPDHVVSEPTPVASPQHLLERAEQMIAGGQASIAIGAAGHYLWLKPTSLPAQATPVWTAVRAGEELDAALGILSLEGGGYPQILEARDDEQAVEGLRVGGQRVLLVRSLPLASGEGLYQAWLVVLAPRDDEDIPLPSGDVLDRMWEALTPLVSDALGIELWRLWTLLGVPGQVEGVGAMPAAPSGEDGPPRHGSASASVTEDRSGIAAEGVLRDLLARRWAAAYPVDNDELLTPTERKKLVSLSQKGSPCLILGEPSVGKTFYAYATHVAAGRPAALFGVVDAAHQPPDVLALELLGDTHQPGWFSLLGRGGTVVIKGACGLPSEAVLPWVGEADRAGVALTFVETYAGPERGLPSVVPRWVREVVGGRFLHVAPLRERSGDILRFADHYLMEAALAFRRTVVTFSPEAEAWLVQQPMLGNHDELRYIVRQAVLRASGEQVDMQALGVGEPLVEEQTLLPGLDEPGFQEEREGIQRALEAAQGNKSEAARLLGVSRGKLLRRMEKLGMG